MFMGTYRHNIDVKGRLILPATFRKKFEDVVVLSLNVDHCINVFTYEAWTAYVEKLKQLPDNKRNARDFIRLTLSKATEVEIDKMGRVNIPAHLMKDAYLDKSVVVIGNIDHVEIWDEKLWDEFDSEKSPHLEEYSEELIFG